MQGDAAESLPEVSGDYDIYITIRRMGPCPYCGEGIGAEARICRHCNRPVLYSVSLTASLEERQKHEILRLWQKEDLQNVKHLIFGPYADAKKQLDKIPLALAWDLNRFQASVLAKKFENFGVEPRLQGGLPSTFVAEVQEEKRPTHFLSFVYASGAVALIFAAVLLFWERQKASQSSGIRQAEIISTRDRGQIAPLPQFEINQPRDQEFRGEQGFRNDQGFKGEQKLERESVEYILSATVFISGENSLGSGFLVTSDGYIVSNSHVTKDMSSPMVTLRDGQKYKARKIREDSKHDISLIKIDERNLPYLKLGDANKVFAGEPVITIGNPGGLSFTVTRGIVSFNGRRLGDTPYIQTDAAINRGNSGGPMISQNLEVIGINTLTSLNEQGISFALPINLACDVNGITSGIGTEPSVCLPYEPVQAKMDMGMSHAQRSPAPNQTGPDLYREEAESLQKRLMAEEQDINARNAQLQARAKDLASQAQADPGNNSLIERLKAELADLEGQIDGLQKEQAEARLKYLNGVIGLLERQSLDSSYSQLLNDIQAKLSEARQARQQLIDFLSK